MSEYQWGKFWLLQFLTAFLAMMFLPSPYFVLGVAGLLIFGFRKHNKFEIICRKFCFVSIAANALAIIFLLSRSAI